MTVSSQVSQLTYTGNSVTTDFPYPGRVFDPTDLEVRLEQNSGGASSVKTYGVDYSLTGVGSQTGGLVQFVVPPTASDTIKLKIVTIAIQNISIRNQTKFYPFTHEDLWDRMTMLVQKNERKYLRTLYDLDYGAEPIMALPSIAARKGKLLGFADPSGSPEAVIISGTTPLSQSVIGGLLYPQSTAEGAAPAVPTEFQYPTDDEGINHAHRFGALGNDSADDYAAINKAILVAAAAGGGDVFIRAGKIYRISQSLVIPSTVRLMSTGGFGHPSNKTAVIKPTNAVSVGIDLNGANRRGVAIDRINVDMSLMPNGSTGIRWSGVHQAELGKVGVYGLPDATSIGIHFRGDAISSFGTLYIRARDLNVSQLNVGAAKGIGIKLEKVGAESVNAILIEGARVAFMTTGWVFDGTGSGILCLNCNSEGNTGDGVQVLNTNAGTVVQWKGGEISSNGGWGVRGSLGRIIVDNTTMSSNTSGDMNTAELSIGIRILAATSGPAYEIDGAHLRTNKSFVGGDANQTIVASDTIAADAYKKRLTAASPIIMSSNPQIADGQGNQLIMLIGTSNTNTVTLVNGNGLKLKSGIVLGANDTITLLYDAGGSNDWVEQARNKADGVVTFTAADATPSVANGNIFKTAGSTTITMFDDGEVGKTIKIRAGGGITITNGANLELAGAANFVMTALDTLTLTMYTAGTWTEDGRSVN